MGNEGHKAIAFSQWIGTLELTEITPGEAQGPAPSVQMAQRMPEAVQAPLDLGQTQPARLSRRAPDGRASTRWADSPKAMTSGFEASMIDP